MKNPEALVSVTVVTYNSSKYVLETLESIKAQTYRNLELIISDDCSTDNTVEVCKGWIDSNRDRFTRAVLLESPINTGVSANGNRAREACRGEWVKGIGGDDIMLPNCIKTYVDHILKYPSDCFLFSRIQAFGGSEEMVSIYNSQVFDYSIFQLTPEEQYNKLIVEGNCIPAPTFFYNRKALDELDVYNDERIPMLEDWPKWLNIINKGGHLKYIDFISIMYRLSPSSLSKGTASPRFYESNRLFYFLYRYEYLLTLGRFEAIERTVNKEVDIYKEYIRFKSLYLSVINSLSYKIGHALLSPIRLIKKLINK